MKALIYTLLNILGCVAGIAAFLLTEFLTSHIVSFLVSIPFVRQILYLGMSDAELVIHIVLLTSFAAGFDASSKLSLQTEGGFVLGAFLYSLWFGLLMFGNILNLFYYSGFSWWNILYTLCAAVFFIFGIVSSFKGEDFGY